MMNNETNSAPKIRQIANCCPTKTRDNPNQGRVYDPFGVAPALTAAEGGNRMPFVMAVRQINRVRELAAYGVH